MWPKSTSKSSWYAPYGLQNPTTGVKDTMIGILPPIDPATHASLVKRADNLSWETPMLGGSVITEIAAIWQVVAYQAKLIEDLEKRVDQSLG